MGQGPYSCAVSVGNKQTPGIVINTRVGGRPGRKEHLVGTGGSGHTLEMVPGLGVTENHFANVSVWTFLAV